MSFTSFSFLCFYACTLIVYYLFPAKLRWMVLLAASVVFYLFSGNSILILYPVAACLAAYAGICLMGRTAEVKKRRMALALTVLLLVGSLFVLKYVNFGIHTVNGIAGIFGAGGIVKGFHLLIPLGISFYTFSLLGYVIDVYNKIAVMQKNFFKLALYGMYFPSMLSGPILRYREDGEQFFQPHFFDYKQITFGMQRMLWGFFKTLVISERMNLVVNTVYDHYADYNGIYIWLATVCFAFQLYANFSGSMDIALGVSQTFGIRLPENFETPFFSRTISEYWRRWHITLGVWMKEYVFYPLLRTQAFTRLGKKCRERFGKKRGKQMTTFAAMLILWFTVGVWHGGDWKFIIGSGLLHWFYIVAGELLNPVYKKIMEKCRISPESRWLNVLRVVRTFFLVNIGFVFFRADSAAAACRMLAGAFRVGNMGILFHRGIFSLGLDSIEFAIAVISLLMLLAVSLLQNKESVRERIARKNIVVRWAVWYALLFYVILLGYYGPGYSAAEFIYQGF